MSINFVFQPLSFADVELPLSPLPVARLETADTKHKNGKAAPCWTLHYDVLLAAALRGRNRGGKLRGRSGRGETRRKDCAEEECRDAVVDENGNRNWSTTESR